MKKSSFILLTFFLLLETFSLAQTRSLKFRSYTINEGLSQGTIFNIVQDKEGFIWLGTADGLNRFDGYNFKAYKDSVVFPSTRRMIIGPDKKIYLGTSQFQVAEFDRLNEKYKLLLTNSHTLSNDSKLTYLDTEGNLWYTNDSAVYRYNVKSGQLAKKSFTGQSMVYCFPFNGEIYALGSTGKIYSLDPVDLTLKKEVHVSSDKNFAVADCWADSDSSVWISGSTGDFYNIHLITSKIRSYRLPPSSASPSAFDVAGCFLRKGDLLFVGTEKRGLLLFDVKKEIFIPLNVSSKSSEQLLGGRISALFIDKTDNLWVACDPFGVSVADLKEPKFKKINTGEGPGFTVRNNFVKAVFKDSTHFYVGYYRDGFDRIEWATGKVQSFKKNGRPDGLRDDVIMALEKDGNGNLWVGTESGLQKLSPGSTTLENYFVASAVGRVDNIKALPNGDVLVALPQNAGIFVRTGTRYQFQYLPGFDDTWITHFSSGGSGKIWASGQAGLYSLQLEKKDSTYSYRTKKELTQYGRVKASCETKPDEVWVATTAGLVKYNPVKNTSRRYNEKDGMANSFVYGLLPDRSGRIWLSTNKGLACFDPEKEIFRNYTEQDGLQGNEFNTNVFALQPDGEMIFGGLGGFNYFYPEKVGDNLSAPQVNITSIKLFDEPMVLDTVIEYKKRLDLPYYNNTLSFDFAALEFTSPEQNQYAYQMADIDRDWVYCGKKRFARYAGLAPGKYIFRVKASNSDGVWTDTPVELAITISPPFWKTTSFIVALILAGIVLIYLFVRFYTRKQVRIRVRESELEQNARMSAIVETEDKERKRIASELHDGLGQMLSTARLNVSGLQAISSAEDKALVNKSLKIIDEACEEVRHISHNMMPGALIQMGLIPALEDLIENVNASKALQVHFNTNLDRSIGESKEITVYRITQEILNNILKHAEAANVYVSIMQKDRVLQMEIRDDGKGFSTEKIKESTGIGWKNIYSRVAMLNGSIRVDSAEGKGMTVSIKLGL